MFILLLVALPALALFLVLLIALFPGLRSRLLEPLRQWLGLDDSRRPKL